jgi:hypothetical protein
MSKSTIFFFSLLMSVSCITKVDQQQSYLEKEPKVSSSIKSDQEKYYTQALNDYIIEIKKQKLVFSDTLFIANRKNGQADDFPEINLPEELNGFKLVLIDPDKAQVLQMKNRANVYINLVGWIEKTKAEFMFVTFSNGFEHQFDIQLNYTIDSVHHTMKLLLSNLKTFKIKS